MLFCLASGDKYPEKIDIHSQKLVKMSSFSIRPHAEGPNDRTTKRTRPVSPVKSLEMVCGSQCDNMLQTKMQAPKETERL